VSIPVTVQSKASVCGRLIAGIPGSNPSESMDVCPLSLLCCVGSGLCDELITCSGESYRVCVCLIVCHIEASALQSPSPDLDCSATEI
jgi:hypothetical protein